jgi:butyryl-CoA dehydrogenase
VALAGLNHKCGWRGTVNTLLNFGEGQFPVHGVAGAVGYRVGEIGDGLRCMFHMMNEARIGVGMAATVLGWAGYEASLAYARQRPQGRPMMSSGKDVAQPMVPIIEHADVKRMLLAQKAYAQGALALELYCAKLVDDVHTGDEVQQRQARELLEVLTPIAKSWPSEWCLEANSLAIQVHGGYGYTRDFPVEQFWRDNRLNMIHEGTHGIQALDLLGRKVRLNQGAGLKWLGQRMQATADAGAIHSDWHACSQALNQAWQCVLQATQDAWRHEPGRALANAVPYMQAFGHVVMAWIWLDVALASPGAQAADLGRRAACRYFYRYELPKINAWLQVVSAGDSTCADVPAEAF